MNEKQNISKIVGYNIRLLRKSRSLTIESLAFDIGIEYTQLSRIERGTINTSLFQLYRISVALNIPLSKILEGIEITSLDDSDSPNTATNTSN